MLNPSFYFEFVVYTAPIIFCMSLIICIIFSSALPVMLSVFSDLVGFLFSKKIGTDFR